MKHKNILYILGACVFLYIIWHFLIKGGEQPQNAINVSASSVIQKDATINLQTIGTVEAYSSVDIKSMVTGPLLTTGFKEGDIVDQNQVLFQIDQRSFNASLNQTKANLARDQASLENVMLQVNRNTPLLKKGYISKQDYDTLTTNAASARATVKADEAAVDNAKLQLDYTTIRAPISGKTGSILLKPGSVIKANDTTSLLTIKQINPIYVTFSVPQNKLPAIQENLQRGVVHVKAIINGKEVEEGTLTFVDNTVDITTGTIQLKATFPNKARRLWPGQYVTIDVPVEHIKAAILVPSLALLTGQKGFYVFVIDNDAIAHMRNVVPGSTLEDMTVIDKGLQAGEKVATAGQLRLKEGAKVKISQL